MKTSRALLLAIAAICSQAAFAHDASIYPTAQSGKLEVLTRYGDAEVFEKAELTKLVDLAAIAPDGKSIPLGRDIHASGADLIATASVSSLSQAGTWVFAALYDNGFYVHSSEGRAIATTLAEYPTARDSAHYYKYAKSLLVTGRSDGSFNRIVGHELELVPQLDPFTLLDGKLLPVLVLFHGTPLANAEVEVGDTVPGKPLVKKADNRGVVELPIRRHGWNWIGVEKSGPSSDPSLYELENYSSTLTFRLDGR